MSSASSDSRESSQKEAFESAFSEAVKAFAKDVPLLLHSSGDVVPSAVNPETVHLVSCLTAQYIEKLVDAGLDSHFTFMNNPDEVRVPPPRFQREPMSSKPPPFSETHPGDFPKTLPTGKNANDSSVDNLSLRKRGRKRPSEEYWDDELPAPKIRKQTANDTTTTTTKRRTTKTDQQLVPPRDPNRPVALDEWIGAIGVDLRQDWIRKIHVKDGISAQSFVFPVCHDTYAYNRVREIRAAKRTLDPLLQDSTIHALIQTEGRIPRPGSLGQMKKDDDPEDEALDDGQGEPEWPGLDYILPVHKLYES